MRIARLLIANRGEIAIRIARAAAELDIQTVAVFSEDDAQSLHVRKADEAHPLSKRGAAAYLDGERLLALARATNCDALHPGYDFLEIDEVIDPLETRRWVTRGLRSVPPPTVKEGKRRPFIDTW